MNFRRHRNDYELCAMTFTSDVYIYALMGVSDGLVYLDFPIARYSSCGYDKIFRYIRNSYLTTDPLESSYSATILGAPVGSWPRFIAIGDVEQDCATTARATLLRPCA